MVPTDVSTAHSALHYETRTRDSFRKRTKHLQKKMQIFFLALAFVIGTTSAFIAPSTSAPATSVQTAKGDLVAVTEFSPDALSQTIGFWGQLGVTDNDFWGLGEEDNS
jgi:hypothetical protein